MDNNNITELIGKVLIKIDINDDKDIIDFYCKSGEHYQMCHIQDCCESVTIEDIFGNIDDLIGSPIIVAEEATNDDTPRDQWYESESFTWTFYKLDRKSTRLNSSHAN